MAFDLASLREGDTVITAPDGVRRTAVRVHGVMTVRYDDGSVQGNQRVLPALANEPGSRIERAYPDFIQLPEGL